jgi:transposase
MARGIAISSDDWARIVRMFENGVRMSKIAEKLHRRPSSVFSVLVHHRKTGDINPKPRGGRQKKTIPRQDRRIVTLALRNRRLILRELGNAVRKQCNVPVSDKTITRRLHGVKLFGRSARKKPLLTKKHRLARLRWCRDKRNWTPIPMEESYLVRRV